jgi:DNA polymerase-3 subunit delta'
MTSTAPGMRKIGVIFDADRMGPEAQNAFLKTLEEPPDKTILILATANPAALLPTIISRCHVVSILTNRVEYGFPGVDEAAEALARLGSCAAGGGLRAAMESAEELIGVLDALEEKAEENVRASWERRLEKLEEFIATLSPSERKTRKDALKDACDAAVKGEQVKLLSELLSFVHAWFAQLYQISLGVDPAEIANPEIYRHFDARKLVRDPRAAGRALARAEKLIDDLRWNVNRKLAVSAFCCSFVEDAVDKRAG